ncbi:energy transducer TonB family protein [Aquifex aeolicus]|uniref:TonB C-terminal domain-containing protein n=1 Tax=Aquifex aeolicus (strain VF5) TaxID=224324 RepID=O66813_AQUAE|nr:energy transducer TonB [Aquifex aeolicus]AAC06776.1 putative protein [Aquifex aeolicus VF5]
MGAKYSFLGYLLSGLLHGALLFSLTHAGLEVREQKSKEPVGLSLKTLQIKKEEPKTVSTIKKSEKKTIKKEQKVVKKPKKTFKKKYKKRHRRKIVKPKKYAVKKIHKTEKVKNVIAQKPKKVTKLTEKKVIHENNLGLHGKTNVLEGSPVKRINTYEQITVAKKTEFSYKKEFLKINFEKIRNYVQERIKYPYIARRMGWEGKVILEIILSEKGCESVRVAHSSGHKVLDRNAVETVKALCGKFPKPREKIRLRLPISYVLR